MPIDKTLFTNFPSEDELMHLIMHTSSTVWENHQLVKADIEKWLSNFDGQVYEIEYERLIALWLLGHFTFYNQNEVTHLCKVLYRDLLHLILTNSSLTALDPALAINDFFSKTNIITSEQTSGSGGFIAYFFRQVNDLPITNLFNFSIENVGNNIENVVIIDDVTLTPGTKGQMHLSLTKHSMKYASKNIFLITLIASEDAIKTLTTSFPNLKVVSAIILDSRDKCFNSESDVFSSFPNLIDVSRKFAEHYGKKLFKDPLGYEDGQYTFGFYYNTPDNTLPIFWSQVNDWIPIINRFHKNYTNRVFLKDERFI